MIDDALLDKGKLEVDLQIGDPDTVNGLVHDAAGMPLANANATVELALSDHGEVRAVHALPANARSAKTDRLGRFKLHGFAQGVHLFLRIEHESAGKQMVYAKLGELHGDKAHLQRKDVDLEVAFKAPLTVTLDRLLNEARSQGTSTCIWIGERSEDATGYYDVGRSDHCRSLRALLPAGNYWYVMQDSAKKEGMTPEVIRGQLTIDERARITQVTRE